MSEPDPSLWQTVKADFGAATGWKVLAVFCLLAWMAFQWGFGNDALLPSIAATALDTVDDGASWPSGFAGVAAATAASFVFWALTQMIDAVVMLTGLRLVPRLTERIARFLQAKGWLTSYDQMKWSTRWIIAYATGVSALCLVDLFATGTPGIRHRRQMIVASVLLSAGTVSIVVALVVTAAMVATRIPATGAAADVFIRFARNPLTWIAIFAVVFGVGYLRDRDPHDQEPVAT